METPKLLVIDTEARWTTDIEGSPFTIGRAEKNGLQVNTRPNISLRHAEIVCEQGKFILRDRHSTYGTYLNGKRVHQAHLNHRDRIHLASFELPEIVFLEKDEEIPYAWSRETSGLVPMISDLRLISTTLEGLRVIGTAGVLDHLLQRVTDDAIALTDSDRGFIIQTGPTGGLDFRVARARGRVPLPDEDFQISHKIPEQVIASGKSQFLGDLEAAAIAAEHHQTRELGVRAVACVPLRLIHFSEDAADAIEDSAVIGVLYVDSRQSRKITAPVAVAGLEALSAQAAAAIENAHLYHEAVVSRELKKDLEFASEIQRHLLPARSLKGAYFEVAGAMLPCRLVGGDIYDYFTMPNGSLAFGLADVAGKGSSAALMASMVHGAFMTLVYDEPTPAMALNRVNRVLLRRDLNSRFVTFHYAMLSSDGHLVSCNAGHNYPMIVRRDGTMEFLEVGGMPLGILDSSTYEVETAQLEPGDTVLVFSDGLIDALNQLGEPYGSERVIDCLRRNHDRPAMDILHCMLSSVDCFVRDGPQADDLTAMIVRFRGL